METTDKTSPVIPEKDRNAVSMDLLHRMRLHGMAAAFAESLQATFAETMTPDSFLNWLLCHADSTATRWNVWLPLSSSERGTISS